MVVILDNARGGTTSTTTRQPPCQRLLHTSRLLSTALSVVFDGILKIIVRSGCANMHDDNLLLPRPGRHGDALHGSQSIIVPWLLDTKIHETMI
jgi:hypothetical protein